MNVLPLFPPSPLGLSRTFSTTWRLCRERFWLFAALQIFPFLLLAGAASLFTLLALNYPEKGAKGVVVCLIAFSVAAYILVPLFVIRCQLATNAGIMGISQGRMMSVSNCFAATPKGMLRTISLALLACLGGAIVAATAILLPVAIFGTAFLPALTGTGGSELEPSEVIGSMLRGALLGFTVWGIGILVLWYCAVRLLYVLPAVANEGLGVFRAIKRSFQLTKGEFWRTFGYLLLLWLAINVPLMIVSQLVSPLLLSTASLLESISVDGSRGVWITVAIVVVVGVNAGLGFCALIYQQLFCGVMYVDRVRREQLGPLVPYWQHQVYGYPAPAQAHGASASTGDPTVPYPQPTPTGYPQQDHQGPPAQPGNFGPVQNPQPNPFQPPQSPQPPQPPQQQQEPSAHPFSKEWRGQ